MADKDELIIERIFDAPVEEVWKYWTEPEYYAKWWGPKDFTGKVKAMDVRVGGKFLGAMHGPAGTEFDKDFWSTGVYKEIIPMEKIVVTDSFADENGNVVPSTYYGMSNFPLEMLITVTFEKTEDGKTKMTLRHSGIEKISDTDRSNMQQGWNQSLDKIAASLKGGE